MRNTLFNRWKGIIFALAAAFLFGTSTPLTKFFLPYGTPLLIAGLLYLGSGIGLGFYSLLDNRRKETALSRLDLPWLSGAIIAGGMIAPVLLMWGLAKTPASNAALLLNLEGVLTALLAWFVFKENFDRRITCGMFLITAGSICISWIGHPEPGVPWRTLAIVGACLSWGIDNNLTRKISAANPRQIAMLKGLIAGGVNTGLALALGAKFPPISNLLLTSLVGFFGYGVSLTLFVLALRHIGAARTGAYFSTAPFVGALLSILILGDKPTLGFTLAAPLMGFGVWLHMTERHEHEHRHKRMEHEHLHSHDEHHRHNHGPHDPVGEPHSHWHRHEEIVHTHPHYPDTHHQHAHSK